MEANGSSELHSFLLELFHGMEAKHYADNLYDLNCFRYSLSYIPFARRIVSDLMFRLFDTEL